jgi:peptidoglycan/LPS O-acetylase OafA/YrhL
VAIADVEASTGTTAPGDRTRDDPPSSRTVRIPYFPGLDGLRGLAVAAVLFFHGGFSWMVGGYLGVSTFFTLSGFLITSLLLAERASEGQVRLRAFWRRRFRRLMPASLACLALILVFGVFAADTVQRENLAGDVISALGYVANWRFIFSDQSYAELFAEPSPVLHFWSLAIEEQYYVLYPLLIAALVGVGRLGRVGSRFRAEKPKYWARRIGRRYRTIVAVTLLAVLTGSVMLSLFAGFDDNRIYLGTDTRVAEIVVGALLAVLLFDAGVTRRLATRGPVQYGIAGLGAAALAASVLLWVRTPQTAGWLYDGGLALYACLSTLIIAAAILPRGPVVWLLSLSPLHHLGKISYGVYLYHWPVFLWLRQRTELDLVPRFVLAVAITLVLAEASFRFLESPIRQGHRLLGVQPFRLAPVAIVGLAVGVVAISATAPRPAVDFERAQESFDQSDGEVAPPTTQPIDPNSLTPPTPRVQMFGDSTALMTGWGLGTYLRETGEGTWVTGVAGLGCGVVRAAERRVGTLLSPADETCLDWETNWRERVEAGLPDLAVVQSGNWDVTDVRLPGSDEWRGPGDPAFDEFLMSEMLAVVDVLTSTGGIVAWLTSPPPAANFRIQGGWEPGPRLERFNELVRELPERRPGQVIVVELDEYHRQLPPDEDVRLRSEDGVHVTQSTSHEVATEFLAPALLDAWREQWVENRRAELEAGGPVRVAVFGDATAERIAEQLEALGSDRALDVVNATLSACGIGRGGNRQARDGPEPLPPDCNEWEELIYLTLIGSPTDVALVHTGVWDVTDRQLDGDETWRAPGDPFYDQYLLLELAAFTDTLQRNGARNVVWLLTPHVDWGDDSSTSAPSRIDRLNELILEVAATRDFVVVLDYAAFARDWDGGEFDEQRRRDGVNPTPTAAAEIADWLSDRLVQTARGVEPDDAVRAGG